MAQIPRRAFAIKQWPRFGRGPYSDDSAPATVRSSPYFWWFRFLQLNDDYEAALNGKRNHIRRSVVKAFGPVRGVDFKTWWSGHSELFAEPHTKYRMKIATSASELVPFGDTDGLNLVVPLDWNAKALQLSFSRILNKLVKQGRVRTAPKGFAVGDAPYKIGRKWNIAAMVQHYTTRTDRILDLADAPLAATRRPLWMAYGYPMATGQFLFVAIAYLCLTTSYMLDDFSVANVANNLLNVGENGGN